MFINSASQGAGVRHVVGILLLLTCVSLPACRKRGPAGPAGPSASADSRQPAAPVNLHLELHPLGAPHYLLRWEQPAGAVRVQAHLVYEAGQSMQVLDPGQVVAAATGAADFAEITLHGDAGLRHLRVTAISVAGVEGPPSSDYLVDATGRVLFHAETPTDGPSSDDLFSMIPADPVSRVDLTQALGQRTITAFRTSPDGRWVAVLADLEHQGQQELFVLAIDGSAPRVRVSGDLAANVATGFAWSPSGDRLAFAAGSAAGGVFEAFVAPRDASTAPRKVSGTMVQGGGIDGDHTEMKWSPDGHRLAYLARGRDALVQELFVATADGSKSPVAVSGDLLANSLVTEFGWSPDGRQLAFVGQRATGMLELFVAPPDGSLAPEVRSGELLISDVEAMQWSPDGTRLAFLSERDAGVEVFVTLADEAMEPVPVDAGFPPEGITSSFAWSPDATRIAFVASPDGESRRDVFVAPATGGTLATQVGAAGMPAHDVLDFAWSPDSAQVAFRAVLNGNSWSALFTSGPGFSSVPYAVSGNGAFVYEVFEYDWSTEGQRLAFRASLHNEDTGLLVVDRFAAAEPVALDTTITTWPESRVAFPHLGSQ